MNRITVLFVSHSAELYGAERSLLTLVQELQRGTRIRPVVMFPARGPLVALMQHSGVHTVVFPFYHWIGRNRRNRLILGPVRFMLNLFLLLPAFAVIAKFKPQIIYTNTVAVPFGALLARVYSRPHVWHLREILHEGSKRDFDFGTRFSCRLLGRASEIICNSRAVQTKFSRLLTGNTFTVVYNGFAFEQGCSGNAAVKYERCVQGAPAAKLLILGHINAGKGHEDALRALAQLRTRGQAVELHIAGSAGSNGYDSFLKQLAQELAVTPHVFWHEFVNDPRALLREAAAVLICTRSEAFGRSAVEAMAVGTPVIGTKSGGLPEIIEHGVTGLLYEPRDYCGLAEQVEYLIHDPVLYSKLTVQAERSVKERFTIARYIEGVTARIMAALV